MKCSARSKRSGQQCQKDAMKGRNTCSMHGGLTPRGVGSASWKHGRYSRSLPEKLAATYRRSMTDPRLNDLKSEISLLDVRLFELASRFKGEEGPMLESDVRDAWSQIASLIELRRRLTETMNRIDAEDSISAAEALAMIGIWATTVRGVITQLVEEPLANKVLGALSRALSAMTEGPHAQPILVNAADGEATAS